MMSQFVNMASSSVFLDVAMFCFFVKCSYWYKIQVNVITCSRVMTIFIYKGLTRYLEIGRLSEFCPISGDWTELGIPNLAQLSQMKC